jgi:hypothetical protein
MSRNPPSDDPTTPLLQSAVAKPIAGADQILGSQGDVDSELRWNESVIQAWRVLATFFCFIVVGANDGTYGVRVKFQSCLSGR